ncbi:hypothetical protein RRG08_037129 [Elysia crispata]|uniref:Uncharacterized protein n=1 Tax=Elysia crispata TaxID=231223 RepID=A0AAE0Y5A1_9GAST|nr:hypothetical protein RRG08_037129 [Elysia crispata]
MAPGLFWSRPGSQEGLARVTQGQVVPPLITSRPGLDKTGTQQQAGSPLSGPRPSTAPPTLDRFLSKRVSTTQPGLLTLLGQAMSMEQRSFNDRLATS